MSIESRVVQARAPHALGRALAATSVIVTGAASAHTWAGGAVPTGPGLLLVAAVVLVGGLLLFTRDVPMWAVLPAVALAQLGLHETFGLAAGHEHTATLAAAAPGWTWQMVLAHGSVTLATALIWWIGRRAASYAVSWREHPALPVVSGPTWPVVEVPVRPLLAHLLAAPRRGPPRGSCPA